MDYYYDNTPANPDDDDFSSINNLFKTRDEDDPIIDFDTGYVNKDGIDFRYIFYPYTIGEKSSSSGFSTKNNLNNIVDLSDIFQNSAVSVVSYVFQDNEEFYEVLNKYNFEYKIQIGQQVMPNDLPKDKIESTQFLKQKVLNLNSTINIYKYPNLYFYWFFSKLFFHKS